MLELFIKTLTGNRPKFVRRSDDNWVDRLNSRATVVLLIACSVLTGLAQWVRNPLSCWLPKNFDVVHREYLHATCWVSPFYYLPYTERIPKVEEDDKRQLILYYQWIPWVIMTQAVLFWLPSAVWHWLGEKSALNSDVIVAMAQTLNWTQKLDKKEERLELLAHYMDYFLIQKKAARTKSHLVLSYLFTKMLYITNILFQVWALSRLLGTDYRSDLITYLRLHRQPNATADGQVWNSPMFPRVAFCDYLIRALGNNRRYTAQCVLPLNMYLDRLYLLLWVWMTSLLLLTVGDLIVWTLRVIVRADRIQFIRNQLREAGHAEEPPDGTTSSFLDRYLGPDGAFILRLIAHNTSAVTSADVTARLWLIWESRQLNDDMEKFDEDDVKIESYAPTTYEVVAETSDVMSSEV